MTSNSSSDSGRRLPVWLVPSIVLCALLSLLSIYKRHQIEAGNRATSLAVEYEMVESLAAAEGRPVPGALDNLRAQGVNALVISEETVSDLIARGQATVVPTGIEVPDPETLQRVMRGMQTRYPSAAFQAINGVISAKGGQISIPMIRQTAIGLDPRQTDSASRAKMTIIARCSNPTGISSEGVSKTLLWAKELGATVFLPQGDQVLGRRDAIPTTIETLKSTGMLYASPEFTKIGGDENVVEGAMENVVRLHSAQSAELDKLPLADAIERYSKAARERNMRILLIRPLSFASDQPLTSFAGFVRKINDAIRKDGGAVGVARPFTDPAIPTALTLAIGLSIVPTAFFVLTGFVSERKWQMAGLALFVLLGLASVTHSGKPYTALLASIVFPTAAFLILDRREGKHLLLEFLVVCLVSIVGGLAVAGLLNSLAYYIRADEFKAVKVAVFLPIIAVGVYFFGRVGNLKREVKSPITWAAALTTLLVLGALGFMLSRTGNDNPAGVSDMELKFRNVLDAVLFVRPRTKSFLVGHPLLIVGIGLLLWRRRSGSEKWGVLTALALTGGAIGQTDMVNTLCHLHTPVELSILRDALGLVPGCIIGLVLWVVVKRTLGLRGEESIAS